MPNMKSLVFLILGRFSFSSSISALTLLLHRSFSSFFLLSSFFFVPSSQLTNRTVRRCRSVNYFWEIVRTFFFHSSYSCMYVLIVPLYRYVLFVVLFVKAIDFGTTIIRLEVIGQENSALIELVIPIRDFEWGFFICSSRSM